MSATTPAGNEPARITKNVQDHYNFTSRSRFVMRGEGRASTSFHPDIKDVDGRAHGDCAIVGNRHHIHRPARRTGKYTAISRVLGLTAVVGAGIGTADAAQILTSNATGLTQSSQSSGQLVYAAQAPNPANPAPGQIVVHIDMRENVYVVAGWDSLNNVHGNKQQPYEILGYPRLYLGADARATNGLKYGAFMEIRNNTSTGFPASGTAGNVGASGNSAGGTLFWRRDYLYIGTDALGTLRVGQTDGPGSLFLTGTFDDFASGLFNGDIIGFSQGGSYCGACAAPNWPFPDFVGAEYTTAKAVYLSPAFGGVDFGLSFEPSTANLTDTQNCPNTPVGNSGNFINCSNQSTSNAANDLQRRRNTIEAGLRYRATYGNVGLAANLNGYFGGHVNPGPFNPGVGGATFTDIHGKTVTLKPTTSFDNLAVGDFGLELTYAGVTIGGNVIYGDFNGQLAPKPSGAKNSVAWITGVEYTRGPLTIGASYFKWQYQGWWTLPTQETDYGFGAGLTYNIAPGLALIGEYLYGGKRHNGFDFSAGVPGANFNNVKTQIAGVGLQFRW